MKVLYADNDKEMADYVGMLLEAGLDCDVLEAASGREAIEQLEKNANSITFIISEIQMPGGGGNIIEEWLEEKNLVLPIIWLSNPENENNPYIVKSLEKSRLNAFVPKPFKDAQFFPIVDKILEDAQKSESLNKEQHQEHDGPENDDQDWSSAKGSFDKSQGNQNEDSADQEWSSAKNSFDKSQGSQNEDSTDQEWSSAKNSFDKFQGSQNEDSADQEWSSAKSSFDKSQGNQNTDTQDQDWSSAKDALENSGEFQLNSSEEENGKNTGHAVAADWSLRNEAREDSESNDPSRPISDQYIDKWDKHRKESAEESAKEGEEIGGDGESLSDVYNTEKFRRVRLKRFLNFDKICCDAYIRLSRVKYVRILATLVEYENKNLEKYKNKGVGYLYIEHENYQQFSDMFGSKVFDMLKKSKKMPSKIRSIAELAAYEHTMGAIKDFGVDERTAEYVKNAVDANLQSLKKLPALEELIANVLKGESYLSEHSLFLAYVTGQICLKTDWGNQKAIEKLAMASLLHDATLGSDFLAEINDLNSDKFKSLSKADQKKVKNHPAAAAKVVLEGEDIFPDVDAIIMQHHEKPDQTGFPQGLSALRISPLSCIFIIAANFVDRVYGKSPSQINIEEIKKEFQEYYNRGNFKKPLEAFLKAF